MLSWLRRLGRDLTGRNDQVLIRHLVGQLEATADAVVLARHVARGEAPSGKARKQMIDIEHRGDDHRHELIVELSSALAPPIDREDLFRLSRSVDDILDNLRDLVREFDLFDITREPLLDDLLEGVADGLNGLLRGVS